METKHNLFFIFLLILIFIMTATCTRQESPKRAGLNFWTVGGSTGVRNRFGENFWKSYFSLQKDKDEFDRFLLAIAERSLTEQQIAEKSGLLPSRVEYFATRFDSMKVIKKDAQGRWATAVPVITDRQMKTIREDLTPIAYKVAQHIKGEAARIKQLYDRVKSPSDPSWEVAAHLILDKFLVDGKFHRAIGNLERERGIKELYDQDQKHLPAFFLERGEHFSTFGSNWYSYKQSEEEREIYVLHGAVFDRYTILMNKYRGNEDFGSALFKITPEGGIDALADEEKEMLKYLEWIADDRLLVPIVHRNTIDSLTPVIENVGRSAAEIVFENHSIIIDSFNDSPYSKFSTGGGDYIQVCYHALFGLIVEQLVKTGVVSAIPKPVPGHFGAFIILGRVYS